MIAPEQKARVTYDNLLRLIDDPDVCDPIKFLRKREIVHYQRFGEQDQSRWNGWERTADIHNKKHSTSPKNTVLLLFMSLEHHLYF